MDYAASMNAAPPKATPCEGQVPGLLDKVLAFAYGAFFVFVAIAGSLWILADKSAALLLSHHVH